MLGKYNCFALILLLCPSSDSEVSDWQLDGTKWVLLELDPSQSTKLIERAVYFRPPVLQLRPSSISESTGFNLPYFFEAKQSIKFLEYKLEIQHLAGNWTKTNLLDSSVTFTLMLPVSLHPIKSSIWGIRKLRMSRMTSGRREKCFPRLEGAVLIEQESVSYSKMAVHWCRRHQMPTGAGISRK